jgi:hypothetical protein
VESERQLIHHSICEYAYPRGIARLSRSCRILQGIYARGVLRSRGTSMRYQDTEQDYIQSLHHSPKEYLRRPTSLTGKVRQEPAGLCLVLEPHSCRSGPGPGVGLLIGKLPPGLFQQSRFPITTQFIRRRVLPVLAPVIRQSPDTV